MKMSKDQTKFPVPSVGLSSEMPNPLSSLSKWCQPTLSPSSLRHANVVPGSRKGIACKGSQ